MAEIMQKWAKELSITDKVKVGSDKNWRDIMTSSRFSMNPRGYGRTSYHLAETLQMGLTPIHLYIDIPWALYMDLYQKAGIGFNTNITGFRPCCCNSHDVRCCFVEKVLLHQQLQQQLQQ
ncbi:unnamed protein product [Polarella glacialis]|uniref:Uncharacterized protein n=1 Tax=Polarella glacialis TaxID=89957 RepID=A0A813DCP3_POLGL|nr:unnamed protein product [Polarella glacialis]